MIADRYNTLQMGIVSTARIMNLLDDQQHVQPNGVYKPERINGAIEFSHVWFAYNDEQYVLKDIEYDLKSWNRNWTNNS